MGCASSQASTVAVSANGNEKQLSATQEGAETSEGSSSSSTEANKYPPAEAFEIPIDNEVNMKESIIKKHPPKRLQRLNENSFQPTTIEGLKEKLAKAEIRRQKFLQQRTEGTINSVATKVVGGEENKDDGHGDDGNGSSDHNV